MAVELNDVQITPTAADFHIKNLINVWGMAFLVMQGLSKEDCSRISLATQAEAARKTIEDLAKEGINIPSEVIFGEVNGNR